MIMRGLVLVVPLLLNIVLPDADEEVDLWEPFRFFVGSWEGVGTGRAGDSEVKREYQFVLGGKFLEVKSESVFQPQEKNPEGEIHENWGLVSHDRIRQRFILRVFYVEGFVNRYVLDSLSTDGKEIVFQTEAIENLPDGWRGRLRTTILNEDEFVEYFDLAAPGKDFGCYIESHLRRKNTD